MTNTIMADISSNNGTIPPSGFEVYKKSGHVAIAIKATQGIDYVNPYHKDWCNNAHPQRLSVVHYHYAELTDPILEAKHFWSTVSPLLRKGDRLVLDIEKVPITGLSPQAYTREFLNFFYDLKREPWIYTGYYYSMEYLSAVDPRSGWWIADYSSTRPDHSKMLAWQFTESGNADGIGKCDLSYLTTGMAKQLAKETRRLL